MALPDDYTIISGGQTGADRAALDFAIRHGIAHGGWCPRGRVAEDGLLDPIYRLDETTSRHYPQRTKWNVRDSDGTVVTTISAEPTGGSLLTLQVAERLGKPCLHLSREESASVGADGKRLAEFLEEHQLHRLNVAGPRESQEPEIGRYVDAILTAALLRE